MKNNYRTEYSVINHNLKKKMIRLNMIIIHTIITLTSNIELQIVKGKGHESKYIEFTNADFQFFKRLYDKNYIYSLNII